MFLFYITNSNPNIKEATKTFTELIENNIIQLRKQIKRLSNQISAFPDGELFARHNGKYIKYFFKTLSSTSYLSHKEKDFIQQLSHKKYLTEKKKELDLELSLSEQMLKEFQNRSPNADSMLQKTSPYFQALTAALKVDDSKLSDWESTIYETNSLFPEQKKYLSPSGNKVRSKSELLIDIALFSHKISFRYECALQLGNVDIYPDFTIKHPRNGKIYYWEHFGLMDDIDYKVKTGKKITNYISHNIYPSIQLITTFESDSLPFTPSVIEETIQYYFE